MDFPNEKLVELRKYLQDKANVTDDHLARGVKLTQKGNAKVARDFGIDIAAVPEMIAACAAYTKEDIAEDADSERYSFEADYMGNLTLRDAKSGDEKYLQGEEAFTLGDQLAANPARQQQLIAQYFDGQNLSESVVEGADQRYDSTFNFPYRGQFATARYWQDEDYKFQLKVVSLRDAGDNETTITPELQKTLAAVAMKRVIEGNV